MKLALLSVGVVVIILLSWNIYLFYSKKNHNRLKEENYLELKVQQQFIVAMSVSIISILAFFGYEKYEDLEGKILRDVREHVDEKINYQTEKLQEDKVKMIEQNAEIRGLNMALSKNIESTRDRLYSLEYNLSKSNTKLEYVTRNIDAVNNIDFLKQVYVLPEQKIFFTFKNVTIDTLYFNKLRTISGNPLPKFNKIPSVMMTRYTGEMADIIDLTQDYMVVATGAMSSSYQEGITYDNTYVNYGLVVIYKD